MGRESSHGRKELFNLPPLVLKARAPNDGSAFCIGLSRLEVPEQTLGGIPLGLGMVMKINFFEFSCAIDKKCFGDDLLAVVLWHLSLKRCTLYIEKSQSFILSIENL